MKPRKLLNAVVVTAATFAMLLPVPVMVNAAETAVGSGQMEAERDVLLVPFDLTVRGQECWHDWLHNHDGFSFGQNGPSGLLVLGLVASIVVVSSVDDDASWRMSLMNV
jgi:hypothetical protein